MKVDVSLFAFLAKYGPGGREHFSVDLEDGTTVGQLIDRLSFPSDIKLLAVINGQAGKKTQRLEDGDEVFIFTPVAGG
jgi:molybdopterin converting factor small subunit